MKVYKNLTELNTPPIRLGWFTNYSLLVTIKMPLAIIVEHKLEEGLKDWRTWLDKYRHDKRFKELYDNFKVLNVKYEIKPLGVKPGLAPNTLEYLIKFYVRFRFTGNLFAGVNTKDLVTKILEAAHKEFKVDYINIDELRIGSSEEFTKYEAGQSIGTYATIYHPSPLIVPVVIGLVALWLGGKR